MQLETAIRASASAVDETSNTADGDDYSGRSTVENFFDFGDQTAEQSNAHLEFLNDEDRDLSMLNRHQEVKQLFLRYNTALSPRAPVEQLFSSGSLTYSIQDTKPTKWQTVWNSVDAEN